MMDRLYNTLQFPVLAPGATSAPMLHGLVLNQAPRVPNLVAAPGCFVNPTLGVDVTATTIRVTNASSVAFAPVVMVWYIHSIARVLGIVGDATPSINPFILTNGGGSGGSGAAEHITADAEGIVSDLGTGNTDNTDALQASFASLTALKRAMYAPGQYLLGNGSDPTYPTVAAGQNVFIWGDGPDSQTKWQFIQNPARVTGITVNGLFRIEDGTMIASPVPGPGNFNMILVPQGAAPGAEGRVEARRMKFDGTVGNPFAVAMLGNGRSNFYSEDCKFGPDMTRPIRNEDFEGSAGKHIHVRPEIDCYDFCMDLSSTTTFRVTGGKFIASRDIGAGSIGINSGSAGHVADEPEYQICEDGEFLEGVLHHLLSQGPYRRTWSRNRHTLGVAGIAIRAGSPVLETGSNIQTPGVVAYVGLVAYSVGQQIFNDGAKIYVVVGAGIGDAPGPTGVGAGIIAGTVTFDYVKQGVLNAAGNLAYSAVGADAASAGIDGFIAAGEYSSVLSSDINIAGVFAIANINRGLDAGTQPWVFNNPVLENCFDTANDAGNIIQRAGTIILNQPRFKRMPNGGGVASGIILTGGRHVINQGFFTDNRVVAAYVLGNEGDVELIVEGCQLDGTFFVIQPLGPFTITLRGGENNFQNALTHNFDYVAGTAALLKSYMRPLTARGADTSTAAGTFGAGKLSTDMESWYVVTDGGTANQIGSRGGIAGPYGFRSGAGYVLTLAAIGPQVTNIGFLAPGTDGVATPVGQTRWFLQDPIDKRWYEQI